MPIPAQLCVLSTSKDTETDDNVDEWHNVHILGLFCHRRGKKRSPPTPKVEEAQSILEIKPSDEMRQCVFIASSDVNGGLHARLGCGDAPQSSEVSNPCTRYPCRRRSSVGTPSFLNYKQGKVERRGRRGEGASRGVRDAGDLLPLGRYVSLLDLAWVTPRAASLPLSQELREELRLNPARAEPTTYPSHGLPRRASRPAPAPPPPNGTPRQAAAALRTWRDLLEVDVCGFVTGDLWINAYAASFGDPRRHPPRHWNDFKKFFHRFWNLLLRGFPKTDKLKTKETSPHGSEAGVDQPVVVAPSCLHTTPLRTTSSMAETRVWVRLRFLRQKDMLKFLQWYASTATLTPMDMGVGAHPRVKEAAVAFVRQVGEHQSACGMSFSTNKGSINSELSKERNVLMKPSRQWESYLRPRKDHRRNLSYSHFPLYLWQSFLPLAKYAFYCCERGLLRIEPYYNIDKAPKCAILHRGRPKEKCHDVRNERDVNTTRTRTWTAHSGKQPNEGNLRTAPDRWQSAHSVPPFRCHREYSPKEGPRYPHNMHYTNSNPQTSEEARHSFESLDLRRRTSNRYKFDTVSIHSHEKGSDEDGSESWLRDHNGSNRWDKVCFSDMFLCISEFYLLFYDSFGGLKFHLKLDDISAIFTPLLHPWHPIKSVEGATILAKNNRESSSTWKPFGDPFIRFKMNTGGDEMNEPTLSVNFTFLPFVPPPSTSNCRKEASRDDVWKRQLDFLGVLRSLNKRTRYVDVDYEHYAKVRRKARLRRRQPQPPVDPSKDLTSDAPWGGLCDSPEPTYIVWLRDADLIYEAAEAHEGALEWSSHLRTMSDSTDTCEVAGGALSEKSPVTALPPTLSLPISVKEERRIAYDIYTSVCLAAPPFLSIDEKESESWDSQSDESCVPNSSRRHSSISGYSNEVEYFHGDTTRVIRTSEILNLYFAEAIRDDLTRDGSRVISVSDVLNLSSVDSRHDDLTCNTSGLDKNSSSQTGGIDLRSLAEPLFEAEPDEYVPIKPQRRNSLLLRKFR